MFKFRAWHNKAKVMINCEFFNKLLEGQVIGVPYKNDINGFQHWIQLDGNPFGNKDLIVQQYSDFLDKNNKQICYDDIILVPSSYTEHILEDGSGPTYPENQIVKVIIKNGCYGAIMERDDLFSNRFYSLHEIVTDITGEPIEIIGNIYENPELNIK